MSGEEQSWPLDDVDIKPQKSRTPWAGPLRITTILIAGILGFSITIFGLAVASALQVYAARIDELVHSYPSSFRWSPGWYVAYFTIAAVVSVVHAFLNLVLDLSGHLNSPWYIILGSSIAVIAWIIQLVFWIQCDFTPDYNQCQQFYLVHVDRRLLSGALEGVSLNVTYARVALAFMLLTLNIIYLTLVAIAAYKKRELRNKFQPDAAVTEEPKKSFPHRGPPSNQHVSVAAFYA